MCFIMANYTSMVSVIYNESFGSSNMQEGVQATFAQSTKMFGHNLNPVMLVFIG